MEKNENGNYELQVVNQSELLGRQFTIYGTPDNPLFLAKDVAAMIEHSDVSTMMRVVDEDEKVANIVCTLGGNQQAWFLTEDGLYEVLMQSRKPIAKDFKKGVKAILKEIRKTGGYIATTQDDTPEMIMAKALKIADATIQKQQQRLKAAEQTIEKQSKQLTEQQPKIEFYNTVVKSNDTVDMEESAKILNFPNVGRNKLFDIMREMKVFFGTKARPYQKYIDNGCFKLVEYKYIQNDQIKIGWKVVVFQKGLDFMRCVVKQYLEEQKQKNNDGQMTLF